MRPLPRDLIERIERGATVVTPNRRLARDLKRRFDAAQIADGRRVWASADILPWGGWLERTYAQVTRLDGKQSPLSPAQELALWQQAIADSPYAHSLLDTAATARIAREAAAIQTVWRLDPVAWGGGLSEDSRAFLAWSARVREVCNARQWLDGAQLADAVSARLGSAIASASRELLLYGFDQLDPQQAALLAACRAAGLATEEHRGGGAEGWIARSSYLTEEAEFLAVARAARELLIADPSARIGVVVPDLARLRPGVVRLFDDVLEPDRVLPGRRTRRRPYNLSLGVPLSTCPLVHSALSSLELLGGEVTVDAVGAWLRSPFLSAADQERTRRALLDARLRQRGRLIVTLEALRAEARARHPDAPHACRLLAGVLDACHGPAQQARRKRQPPSAWSTTFLSLLAGLGWPGERTLDSEEYQTWERWRELVLQLSALDPVVGSLGYDDALTWLARFSAETLFQPESEDVPIQVLGVLESAGIEFDHLFVTGLHGERWPAAARPNPLLPVALQRMRQVPHASAEWELSFARRMMALWKCGAAHVAFSFPLRDEDRALRVTPLLADLVETGSEPSTTLVHGYAEAIRASARFERCADACAPPLARGHRVAGGVAVLQNQAACPFRAFAIHRLGARGLEQPVPGLNSRERGTLVHRALADLWGALESHDRLLAASEAELQVLADVAAGNAIERMRRERPDAPSDAFAVLERRRIGALLGRVLDLEKQRSPFRVVARELPRTVDVAGLIVDARIDRVDELDSGGYVILDYKTGRASIAGWADERLDEPQLPLYAVTEPGDVAAVSVVTVSAQEVGFRGLAREDDLLPEVTTPKQEKGFTVDWESLLDRWGSSLDALAGEFLAGHAAVAPKRYPRTCEYCDLGTLCRVRELLDRGPVAADETVDE